MRMATGASLATASSETAPEGGRVAEERRAKSRRAVPGFRLRPAMLTDSQRITVVFVLMFTACVPVFLFFVFALGSWLWAHPWPFSMAVYFPFEEWYWTVGAGVVFVFLLVLASWVMPKPTQRIVTAMDDEDHMFHVQTNERSRTR
jgi:hypothetical protein